MFQRKMLVEPGSQVNTTLLRTAVLRCDLFWSSTNELRLGLVEQGSKSLAWAFHYP